MRHWKTAPVRMLCGYCGAEIQKAEIYLAITFAAVKHEKRRCRECTGEQPHDVDAPATQQPSFAHPMFTLARSVAHSLKRDFKQAAAGREPGEDD